MNEQMKSFVVHQQHAFLQITMQLVCYKLDSNQINFTNCTNKPPFIYLSNRLKPTITICIYKESSYR